MITPMRRASSTTPSPATAAITISCAAPSCCRLSDGRVADAVPLAQRIVDIDGRSGLAGMVLLEQDLKAGKYDQVVAEATTMPREGGQRFAVPLLQAWAEAGRGRPAPALQALDSIGGTNGVEPLRNLHAALIADYDGRVDDAAAAYDKLLAGPQSGTLRGIELAGNFLERHGRGADARKLYQSGADQPEFADVAAAGIARIDQGHGAGADHRVARRRRGRGAL